MTTKISIAATSGLAAAFACGTVFRSVAENGPFIPGIILSGCALIFSVYLLLRYLFSEREDEWYDSSLLLTIAAQIVAAKGSVYERVELYTVHDEDSFQLDRLVFVENRALQDAEALARAKVRIYLAGKMMSSVLEGTTSIPIQRFLRDRHLRELFTDLFSEADIRGPESEREVVSDTFHSVAKGILSARKQEIENIYAALRENESVIIVY